MSQWATETLIDVLMPQMGVSVADGTVVGWRISVGDSVTRDDVLCEISTDKVDTEVPAPTSGVVAEVLVGVDETVPVGTLLARIATNDATPAGSPVARPSPRVPGSPPSARYSPVVARLAAEHTVDLMQVNGTGRDGRVTKRDVTAFIERRGGTEDAQRPWSSHAAASSSGQLPWSSHAADSSSGQLPESSHAAASTSGQLPRMRSLIAERMKRSLATAAHCHTWIEADMGVVETARKVVGTTALAFVARAAIDALRTHPAVNAWLDGDKLTVHEQVHLGIAVSLGEPGLIVPVIRDAHELAAEGIAARIVDLATRAREGQLTPDEVGGATFTITNPGAYGSMMATPIIDLPQVAILDLEAISKRVVVIQDAAGNDAIAIRPMTVLGLGWDHRALDGALAAQFLSTVKANLEA